MKYLTEKISFFLLIFFSVFKPLEYFEELLNASCQYPNYKQVFVTEPHAECVPFASMAIFK